MPKISAAEFIKTHQKNGRSSKLEPYREDILLLKSKGYTQQQILEFLKLNGITVGMTTLNWFIRSRQNKPKPTAGVRKQSVKPAPAETGSTAGNTPQKDPDEAGKPRKFQWGPPPSDNELFGSAENGES
ncbi:hypothetical protein [Neisseria musculi]|uniref:Uncharacterized protein n=1 Tax=Neisseria musculi TaxID=1815583 RepID=A0A7H1M9M8_9NEIS|nr:hypothetical protein [Neisseria musculi]QNT58343.1 hypothetical protein H7A79_1994 [Neisseria musculi]